MAMPYFRDGSGQRGLVTRMSEWVATSDFAVENVWLYGQPTSPDDVGFVEHTVNLTATPATTEPTMTTCNRSVVLIRWKDAHAGEGGWLEMDDYDDDGLAVVETVGFLIPADEPGGKAHHVTVWQSISEDDGIHPFHIPVEMVLEMTVLNS